ncbi:MAG: DUF3109 family protein [Chloroherpetonaceae bacterium]
MIVIDSVLIGDEVLRAKFRCDLERCKGACCVVGELGAPVTSDEVDIIESLLDKVKPHLPEANQKVLDEKGVYEVHQGSLFLTTVEGRECVFATIDENGIATCNLEKLYLSGESDFRKPISCHLFPIRVRRRLGMEMLVYMQIEECKAGRACGAKEKVHLYEFLAPALERKYGATWTKKFLNVCRQSKSDKDHKHNINLE